MNNNVVKVTNEGNGVKIDELGYLMVTDRAIGVTNSLEDVLGYIQKHGEMGEAIRILPGYKDDLLQLQHRFLLQDTLSSNISGDKIEIPPRFTEWNLVQRESQDSNALFHRISR